MGVVLRIGLCQVNLVVGDLESNLERILAGLREAEASGADVAIFPELAVSGYPPEDLLLKPRFLADCRATLEKLAAAAADGCVAVVGLPLGGERLGVVYNAAAICAEGAVAGFVRKSQLPNYGVFDERRYFSPGEAGPLFRIGGVNLGVSICEDLWIDGGAVNELAEAGAEMILNLNASPYSQGKVAERMELLSRRAAEIRCPIAYVNLIGGQDELIFDGNSMLFNASGDCLARAEAFAEQTLVVDVEAPERAREPDSGIDLVSVSGPRSSGPRSEALPPGRPPEHRSVSSSPSEVYSALVLGTRDYVSKNGFDRVCLGVSGGVDSALTAAIACDALGPEQVCCVLMPSRFTSPHSMEDAEELCENLGAEVRVIPIEPVHAAVLELLKPEFGDLSDDLAEENLQPRIRAVLLMALSNKFGWLVLATGNKTESAVGYSTLYGDTAGALAVIKDVWKMQVYDLARFRNSGTDHPPIPERILTKPPTAELRKDQRDDQSLPPYAVLDPVVRALVEDDKTPAELLAEGLDAELVFSAARLLNAAEHKRRQSPPCLRVTEKAFGKDRRMPITNRYRSVRGRS